MGAVYEAEHTGLGVRVAVKLLNEVFVTDPSAMSRFRREARAAAAIRHPNIVDVTDTGHDEEGVPFIVMELLEGESLSALLRREKILSPLVAATITTQILSGLSAAHEKSVIHRDLKPGNIILARREDGSCLAKILDFGISKFRTEVCQDVTAIGAVIGTPRFMAPEQARGQSDLDHRVDIYAVGVLLYRMVTGKLPFAARTHEEIIHHILNGKSKPPREVRPEVPVELERIILKAMAPEREDRYQSAPEFIEGLHRALPDLAGGTVQITSHTNLTNTPTPLSLSLGTGPGGSIVVAGVTRPTHEHSPPARLSARRRTMTLALGVLLLGGAAVGGYIWHRSGDSGHSTTGHHRPTGPVLNFGITEFLPRRQLIQEHAPLIGYLEQRLRRPVELRVVEDYIDLSAQLAAGKLDLAALTPYMYVRAKRNSPGLKLIATHVTVEGTSYGGLIVARADSGIRDLEDLTGKVFCYVSPTSTSGYLTPRALFRQHGMDPDKSFRATRLTGDHLGALRALESGACQGAAVFAGLLYEAEKHGMGPPQRFHIIASTSRIPQDAYCVTPTMPEEQLHSLREALLALKAGSPTTTSVLGQHSRIIGFAPAKDSDYNPVRRIAKYLDEPQAKKQPK